MTELKNVAKRRDKKEMSLWHNACIIILNNCFSVFVHNFLSVQTI